MITASVSGVNEIDAVLRNLPKALSHKVLGAAHADAAKIVVAREKELAPVGATHNLVDSIGSVKTSLKRANLEGEVKVGPRKRGRYKGFHGHLIEYGFTTRLKPGNPGKRKVKARPFAEPAFRQTKREVEKQIGVSIGKVVLRTMRRYIKRA